MPLFAARGLCGGGGELPRLHRLRPGVHQQHQPELGRPALRRPDEGPGRRHPAALRGQHPDGRRGRLLRRLHDLLDGGPHQPLPGAGGARRHLQPAQHGRHHRGAVVPDLGVRRLAAHDPGARAIMEKWSPANFIANWTTPDAGGPQPERLPGRRLGGTPGLHRAPAEEDAGQVPVLPGRGPLRRQAAEPAAVVGRRCSTGSTSTSSRGR